MIEPTIAIKATKPTVRPTAPPVPSPPLLLFLTPKPLCEFGGAVGVTVTVRTSPVVVKMEMTGVGVHEDVVDLDVVAAWLAEACGELA
jgi:hypothetical protein